MSRRHATRAQRQWKAYRWRRSVDIRSALPGSVRAAPDSRPEHDTAVSICRRLSARRSEYGRTKRALGVDADSTSFTSMGKGLGHGGEATYPLIGEIYALRNGQRAAVERNRTAF